MKTIKCFIKQLVNKKCRWCQAASTNSPTRTPRGAGTLGGAGRKATPAAGAYCSSSAPRGGRGADGTRPDPALPDPSGARPGSPRPSGGAAPQRSRPHGGARSPRGLRAPRRSPSAPGDRPGTSEGPGPAGWSLPGRSGRDEKLPAAAKCAAGRDRDQRGRGRDRGWGRQSPLGPLGTCAPVPRWPRCGATEGPGGGREGSSLPAGDRASPFPAPALPSLRAEAAAGIPGKNLRGVFQLQPERLESKRKKKEEKKKRDSQPQFHLCKLKGIKTPTRCSREVQTKRPRQVLRSASLARALPPLAKWLGQGSGSSWPHGRGQIPLSLMPPGISGARRGPQGK